MATSDEYKRQVMSDLAGGDKEMLPDAADSNYQNFDDFAQRSSRDERHQLFSQSFHPDRVPANQMEPELQKAIAQIKPNERKDVAQGFLDHLKKRGLGDRDLEKQLGLSSNHANRMNADDVVIHPTRCPNQADARERGSRRVRLSDNYSAGRSARHR